MMPPVAVIEAERKRNGNNTFLIQFFLEVGMVLWISSYKLREVLQGDILSKMLSQ